VNILDIWILVRAASGGDKLRRTETSTSYILQIERALSVLPVDRLEIGLRLYAEERVKGGSLSLGRFEGRNEIKDLVVFLGPSV
jgi:hypothetical protein